MSINQAIATFMNSQRRRAGQLLRRIREGRNLGIKTAAAQCGIDYSYLSRVETGQREVKPELVEQLCAIYGVDSADVLARLGQLPTDVLDILHEHGDEALEVLRRQFSNRSKDEPA